MRTSRQRAQILPLLAVLLPAVVIGLGLLVDTALVFKARRGALALADGAAQFGAAQIDEGARRLDSSRPAPIDLARAELEARRYVLDQQPSALVDVSATGQLIRVRVTVQAPTIIWHLPGQGAVPIQAEADAQPFTGVATGQAPLAGRSTSMALTDRPQKVEGPSGSDGKGPRPYNWRATAWLIVGIAVVAGAMGVFMRVIPTPFTQPTPTSAPTARPAVQPTAAPARATAAPTLAPLAAPTVKPTDSPRNQQATVAPAAQATSVPTAVAQVTTAPVSVPTTQPTVAVTSLPQPTAAGVDPALQAEILAGYSHYWEVRDAALSTLDGSHLDEAMYGEELLAAQIYIDQLRSQGREGRPSVEHSITLVSASPETAEIRDQIIDHSIFIDLQTQEPISDQQATRPNAEIDGTYVLRKIDGVWKVTAEE